MTTNKPIDIFDIGIDPNFAYKIPGCEIEKIENGVCYLESTRKGMLKLTPRLINILKSYIGTTIQSYFFYNLHVFDGICENLNIETQYLYVHKGSFTFKNCNLNPHTIVKVYGDDNLRLENVNLTTTI